MAASALNAKYTVSIPAEGQVPIHCSKFQKESVLQLRPLRTAVIAVKRMPLGFLILCPCHWKILKSKMACILLSAVDNNMNNRH